MTDEVEWLDPREREREVAERKENWKPHKMQINLWDFVSASYNIIIMITTYT